MIPSLDTTDGQEPIRLVCVVALVATHGLVRITERYLPEYAAALGYGPILVGALLTLGFGVAVAAAERSNSVGDEPAALDAPIVLVLSTLLAAVGLLVWAGAPALDDLLGTPLSALGWLAVGVALLQAWYVAGPTRRYWPVDTRILPGTSSDVDHPDRADDPDEERIDGSAPRASPSARRLRLVAGALAVAAGAVIATAAVASAGGVRAGVALVASFGAAVALVGAIAYGIAVDRPTGSAGRSATGDSLRTDGAQSTAGSDPSIEAARRAVSQLPDRRRWAVVGDGLVRVAIAGSVPFLILLVVHYRSIALSIGGLSLVPAAVFGLFVLSEALGAVVGAVAAPALVARFDRRALLAVGLAILSLLPMAIVAAPSRFAVVALLFLLLGCRTAIEPLRPTVGVTARAAPVPGSTLPGTVRTAVRLAVVPAPLLGGLLYAIDPLVAFTVATTVGLLGVRELGRAFSFGRDP